MKKEGPRNNQTAVGDRKPGPKNNQTDNRTPDQMKKEGPRDDKTGPKGQGPKDGMEVHLMRVTSGNCSAPVSRRECRDGTYHNSSMEYEEHQSNNTYPRGCYVHKDRHGVSRVSFNDAKSNVSCSDEKPCMCKRVPLKIQTYGKCKHYVTNEHDCEHGIYPPHHNNTHNLTYKGAGGDPNAPRGCFHNDKYEVRFNTEGHTNNCTEDKPCLCRHEPHQKRHHFKERKNGKCSIGYNEEECKEIADDEEKTFATDDSDNLPAGCIEDDDRKGFIVFNKPKRNVGGSCDDKDVTRCFCKARHFKERRGDKCSFNFKEDECKEIADDEGKKFSRDDDDSRPAGCFEDDDKKEVVFNGVKAKDGKSCDHKDVTRCFCKAPHHGKSKSCTPRKRGRSGKHMSCGHSNGFFQKLGKDGNCTKIGRAKAFKLRMRMNRTFDKKLEDRESEEFFALKTEVEESCVNLVANGECQVVKFTEGSVVAEVDIVTDEEGEEAPQSMDQILNNVTAQFTKKLNASDI